MSVPIMISVKVMISEVLKKLENFNQEKSKHTKARNLKKVEKNSNKLLFDTIAFF